MTDITVPLQQQEFAISPEGPQPAACYGVVLMGTFDGPFGKKKKIRLMYELHGDEKMSDGRPFVISADFNFSSNEKASLRLFIEKWRGRNYTNSELKETNGLPISKLVGQPAYMDIVHETKDDRTYANIQTIMRPPPGTKIDLHNDLVIYSVDNHDELAFQKLSPRLQEKIKTTEEWKIRTGAIPNPAHQQQPETSIPSDWDDSIPF